MTVFALLIALVALALAISALQSANRRADAQQLYAQELWRELDGRIRALTERLSRLESGPAPAPAEQPADLGLPATEPAVVQDDEVPDGIAVSPLEAPIEPDRPLPVEPPSHETPVAEAAFTAEASQSAPADESPIDAASGPSLGERFRGFDWESLVGVKLFSWIAGIALVIGGVLFLRYSIDHGWLVPPVRMALGFATGIALLLLCELRVANHYRVTANAMDGAGIALLYATIYASHALWGLMSGPLAFVLMIAVTAVAVFLSIRRESAFIALLGLIGGFSTPALLSSGENRPIILFSYLLLVNAGVAWVAHRKRWPWLSLLSVAFTVFYQWAWVEKFLEPTGLPLAATIFLIFPIFTVLVYLFTTRTEELGGGGVQRFAASASAVVPLLFTIYVAVVPAYGARFHLLFGVLVLVRVALAFVSLRRPALVPIHRIGSITSLAVVLLWLNASWTPAAWPSFLAWVAALIAVDAFVPAIRTLRGADLGPAERQAAVMGALLLATWAILPRIEPATRDAFVFFGSLFLLSALLVATAFLLRQSAIYGVVAIASFAAQWQWGSVFLTSSPAQALIWWTAIGALFLLAPGVATALHARREEHEDERHAILPHFGLQAFVLLLAIAGRPRLFESVVPLLFALGALLIASSFSALIARRASRLAPSLIATNLVLVVALAAAERGSAVTLVIVAALITAATGLVIMLFARRAHGEENEGFLRGAIAGFFAAQITLAAATVATLRPPVPVLIAAHVLLAAGLLWLAAVSRWHRVAAFAAAATGAGVLAWLVNRPSGPGWPLDLALGVAAFLPYLLYPFAASGRIGSRLAPYATPIVASVWLFLYARPILNEAGYEGVIGLLPVLLALAMGLVLWQLLRTRESEETASTRLALVAATVLGFLTVAIPLQFERQWITLGWLLEAAALAWLFTRIPHRGLLVWSWVLYVVGFARLVLNLDVYRYYERSGTPILNWYLYTYLLAAAAFFAGQRLLRRSDDEGAGVLRRILPAGGTILLFALLNIEIADYYSTGAWITFRLSQSLAQDLTYTIAWALFAIALLVAGIAVHNRAARVASIGLLVVTIVKCFLHDLAQLGGLYRVGAFLGLAVSLAAVALLLQRFVLRRQINDPAAP